LLSTQSVSGTNHYGGLVGYSLEASVASSFWNTETSGQGTSAAGTGLTTAQMQDINTYLDAGWDFVNETANGTQDIWAMSEDINDGYPYLTDMPVGIADESETRPALSGSHLLGNYPNPFNPTTTIRYSVAAADEVSLAVYNTRGQMVKTLVSGPATVGAHEVIWDGRDDAGRACASGVYFCRLKTSAAQQTRKMLLLK